MVNVNGAKQALMFALFAVITILSACHGREAERLAEPTFNVPSAQTYQITVTDGDMDVDGVPNTADNCISIFNPDQKDSDGDGVGDLCDDEEQLADTDNDGIGDSEDNCPGVFNPGQQDYDNDKKGFVCDEDDVIIATDKAELGNAIITSANSDQECKDKGTNEEKMLCIFKKRLEEIKQIGFTHAGFRPHYSRETVKVDFNNKVADLIRESGLHIFLMSNPSDKENPSYIGIFNGCKKNCKLEQNTEVCTKPTAIDGKMCKPFFDVQNFDPWHCPAKQCDKPPNGCDNCSTDANCQGGMVCNKEKQCVLNPCDNPQYYKIYPPGKAFDPSYDGDLWERNLSKLSFEISRIERLTNNDIVGIDWEVYEHPDRYKIWDYDPTLNLNGTFLDAAKRLKDTCHIEGKPYFECFMEHWLARGKNMYNKVRDVASPYTPIIFYAEYKGPVIRSSEFIHKADSVGYRFFPSFKKKGDCISGAQECMRINSEDRSDSGDKIQTHVHKIWGNTTSNQMYMPPGTGDFPNPSLYMMASPVAFDETVKALDLKGAIAWISFSYLPNSVSNATGYPCVKNRFMIKWDKYAQYIGWRLRQAGVKGVIFYGDNPFNLELKQLNWGYTWDEWKTLRKAFIKGYRDNEQVDIMTKYKYVYENYESGNKNTPQCILTIHKDDTK